MRRYGLLACLLAFMPTVASADDVFLKGGGKISGRILSRTATSVEVDVGAGTVTVPMSSVVRIEEKRSVLDDYSDREERVRADDVNGWLELAGWSSSQGLGTQARRAYEQVLALDPQNVDANQALGRVLLDGRWVTEEESYKARGYVQFEGEWISPEEQDAILRERAALTEAEQARLDAERRAQDAESRAAEAEARARAAEAVVPWYTGYPLSWGGWGPAVWPSQPIVVPPGRPGAPPATGRPPSARPPARPPPRPQPRGES